MEAFENSEKALLDIENLLKGISHHVLPTLLFGLNDVITRGFEDVAMMMINHVAQVSAEFQKRNGPNSMVLMYINGASLGCISGLEDQVLAIIH